MVGSRDALDGPVLGPAEVLRRDVMGLVSGLVGVFRLGFSENLLVNLAVVDQQVPIPHEEGVGTLHGDVPHGSGVGIDAEADH
jgi:hypothetical protein